MTDERKTNFYYIYSCHSEVLIVAKTGIISVEGVRFQASDANPIDFVIIRNLRVCDMLYILIQTLHQMFGNHHHLCVLHLKGLKMKKKNSKGCLISPAKAGENSPFY